MPSTFNKIIHNKNNRQPALYNEAGDEGWLVAVLFVLAIIVIGFFVLACYDPFLKQEAAIIAINLLSSLN